ncbi:ROK family protein [Sinomonas soli]
MSPSPGAQGPVVREAGGAARLGAETHAIGVDLGGTKTAAGLVSAEGELLFGGAVPTPSREGASAVVRTMVALVRRLLDRAEAEGISPTALGVGAAGVIDAEAGVVRSSTEAITDWAGTRLAAEAAEGTGLPTTAVNDVHAHAVGEAWRGAGAGTSSSLLLAFGTGVGASFTLDGRPLLGHRWVAGHAGHIASPFAYQARTPLPCVCGGAGHLEAIASGPGLYQAYLRLGGTTATDARAVARLAHTGDRPAAKALELAAAAAGQALGGIANLLDPEAVIVTGGLAEGGPLWWEAMERAFHTEVLPPLRHMPVRPAGLGASAAILGAARLALTVQPLPEQVCL